MVERSIDVDTVDATLPKQVPAEIWGYARAFLLIERLSARFVWRADSEWLDVQLVLESSERVLVRVSTTEMPRGVTARELDVLTLVALGLTNAGIAERLGTSARTVSSQLERLLEKLGQSSRGGLAAIAVDLGLLRLPLPGGPPEEGGIAVAQLELASHRRLDRSQPGIRADVSARVPIRLGVIVPDGAGSDSDQVRNGALLAIDEINQLGGIGGRTIEVFQERVDIFDWSSVEAGLQRIFDSDVDAIITSYVSAEHPQFIERIAEYGRPFLHTATFEADVLRTESEPWRYGMVFQTCASETYYGPGMLRLLGKLEAADLWRGRTRSIVSIEMPSESMHLTTPAFLDAADAQGWRVAATIGTPVGETDWPAVIEEARSHDPDVVLIANFVDRELIEFQRAFLRAPMPALVYGIYTPSIPSFTKSLGEGAHGIIWSTTTGTYDDDLGRRFRNQYRVKYGEDPGWSQAGAVYDQVRMLAAAWSSVDSRSVADVVRYLRRWPYRGVNGVYYFGETGQAPKLYPDMTSDAALGQAHLVYQIGPAGHALLDPEPFGIITDFVRPSWFGASD
ncbi:ABC transporter substrate-binding protein [Leucobacter soli]|uniref:ABC transporter substrate-binding protein n=1 Tax=Leucobacter soli TaxID=2812850 RepID=UPI001C404F14|nr:ABC transporter substrate-binding protein [Leucobacter soli]